MTGIPAKKGFNRLPLISGAVTSERGFSYEKNAHLWRAQIFGPG